MGKIEEGAMHAYTQGLTLARKSLAEPSQEVPTSLLDCRKDAKAGERLVEAQERWQDVVLDHLAGGGSAAGEEAHDLWIAVEIDQVVHVGRREPAQHHTLGFQENCIVHCLSMEKIIPKALSGLVGCWSSPTIQRHCSLTIHPPHRLSLLTRAIIKHAGPFIDAQQHRIGQQCRQV